MRLFNDKIVLKMKETRLQHLSHLVLLFGWYFTVLVMWGSLNTSLQLHCRQKVLAGVVVAFVGAVPWELVAISVYLCALSSG